MKLHGRVFGLVPILGSGVMALGVAACGHGQRTADSLEAGDRIVVHLALDESGSLQATEVDVEDEQEGGDDDVECEQEGEHEGENEGCLDGLAEGDDDAEEAEGESPDFIVASIGEVAAQHQEAEVLGIALQLDPTSTLTVGTHWLSGRYLGADTFEGTVTKVSPNERLRFLGTIDAVRFVGDSVLLTVFDREITVDRALGLNEVDSLEEAVDLDVDCEQEGESEGENAGC